MRSSATHVRLGLDKYDGTAATYRSHIPGEHPHEFVGVFIDRDRFNALGKPGYIDVTIAVPSEAS